MVWCNFGFNLTVALALVDIDIGGIDCVAGCKHDIRGETRACRPCYALAALSVLRHFRLQATISVASAKTGGVLHVNM